MLIDMKRIVDTRAGELPIRKRTDLLIVHRAGQLGWTPDKTIGRLRPHWHGQHIAYHYFVDAEGQAYEVDLPSVKRYHAGTANRRAQGVACILDGRTEAAPVAMLGGLRRLLVHLCRHHRLGPEAIRPHGGTLGWSRWPNHRCPGTGLPLDWVRMLVADELG